VLSDATTETVLGLAGLMAAAGLAALGSGIATALAIGLGVQAITYLAAPAVTIAADRSLARATGTLLHPIPGPGAAAPGASAAAPRRRRTTVGDPGAFIGQARALETLGRAHLQDGNPRQGEDCLRHVLTIYQLIGDPGIRRVQQTLHRHALTPNTADPRSVSPGSGDLEWRVHPAAF
jgi:hypothetical protein